MPHNIALIPIELSPDIPLDIAREIAKRACYCDGLIQGCQFNEATHCLDLMVTGTEDTTAVTAKVQRLIDQMNSQRLAIQPNTVKERKSKSGPVNGETYKDLCACGDLFPEGIGVVSRSGNLLTLIQRLDTLYQRIATEAFSAEIHDYNVLIPSDWLRRAGYFSSFPHSLTFATHLKEDLDQLDDFAERHRDGENLEFQSLDEIVNPEYCLSPAVCYHAYGALKGSTFGEDDGGLKIITAANRCFRYESRNMTDLTRLWEFTMREIIFIGEGEKVLAARARAMEIFWRLTEELDLSASLETASDPFFASDFKSLRFFQLANELKFELCLPVTQEKSVAAGSFNYHESFFGNSFSIQTISGEPAHTGCAAFGLERFVNAILAQHSFNQAMDRLDKIENNLANLINGEIL